MSTIQERETIECPVCGTEMWDTEQQREEMNLHKAECHGYNDPKERFEKGDRVTYSDFGLKRLHREQREGEIIGFSRKHDHVVRVLWDGRKTPVNLAHRFVKHTE